LGVHTIAINWSVCKLRQNVWTVASPARHGEDEFEWDARGKLRSAIEGIGGRLAARCKYALAGERKGATFGGGRAFKRSVTRGEPRDDRGRANKTNGALWARRKSERVRNSAKLREVRRREPPSKKAKASDQRMNFGRSPRSQRNGETDAARSGGQSSGKNAREAGLFVVPRRANRSLPGDRKE